MMFGLSEARFLRLLGYIIFVFGVLGIIQDVVNRLRTGQMELSVLLADGAIMLIGVVAISSAAGLVKLERRVDRLEGPPEQGDQH